MRHIPLTETPYLIDNQYFVKRTGWLYSFLKNINLHKKKSSV